MKLLRIYFWFSKEISLAGPNLLKAIQRGYFKHHRYIQYPLYYRFVYIHAYEGHGAIPKYWHIRDMVLSFCVPLITSKEGPISPSLDLGHRYLRINQGSNCVTQMILKLNQLNCRSVIKYLCILLVATKSILQLL